MMDEDEAILLSETSPKRLTISRDKIRAVYAQGEDAVIALVEGVLERIAVLEERVQVLEKQISKNSRKNSKAPSSDGFKPRVKSQRCKSERSSSGQVGHPGATLEWSADCRC